MAPVLHDPRLHPSSSTCHAFLLAHVLQDLKEVAEQQAFVNNFSKVNICQSQKALQGTGHSS